MLRPSAPTLLLSVLGLSLASFTFACSGASADNSDVDSSKLAVQKKDGQPTGNGTMCSWGGIAPDAPVTPTTPPSSGGSSGGCNTDQDGNYRCWSYDSEGREVDIKPAPGSSTSGAGGVGSTSSSTSSSGGSSGSSGGCTTDEQGNTKCWSYPSDPEPRPPVMPTPVPMPTPEADTYALGDWFPSIDGCNRCTCTSIGIMCTVQVCAAPPPPPPGKGCELDGTWIASGDRVPSPDSCNSCFCGPDGQVACTEMGCADPVPPTQPPAPTPKR